MTRDDIFDNFFRAEGGRANVSRHPAATLFDERRRTYQRFLNDRGAQLAQQGPLVDTHFDFVDNPEINAAAGKAAGLYLIGVNVGAYESLMFLPSALLSWPEMLVQIGDATREVAAPFDFAAAFGVRWEPRSERVRQGASRLLVPRDPLRKNAAFCMTMMAMDVILAHEFGHVLAGHVDFMGNQGLAFRLNERGAEPGGVDVTLMRALELEADLDAGSMLASAVLERLLIGHDFSVFFDQETVLTLWVFTVLLLFHLFDLGGAPLKDYTRTQHPHPEHRLLFALTALQALVQQARPESQGIVDAARERGLAELDRAWSILGLAGTVLQQERRNTKAFVAEGTRLGKTYVDTLEPVRQFAVAHGLGMTFAMPANVQRPLGPVRKKKQRPKRP